MTPPTPTESDKRAARRIIGVYAEFDPESVAKTEHIIAEEMAAERDALRLAKEAICIEHTSRCDFVQPCRGACNCGANEARVKALAAIEKVQP